MTKRERFLTATRNRVPDRVPVAPDMSNYIPAKRTGLPFWDVYFFDHVPLWRAYLNAVDYYGAEGWVASTMGPPLTSSHNPVETDVHYTFDRSRDAMVQHVRIRTPDGDLSATNVCARFDPPSPVEKPVKDIAKDLKKLKWLFPVPTGVDMQALAEQRDECHRRDHAYGFSISYPGFHMWSSFAQGGVEPLAYALMDTPGLLDEWMEFDVERGLKIMEFAIAARPDYITFGGSGTITLASPELARRYAIPALAKFSAMTKKANIPTNLHSCGKSRALVDLLADETDVDCINPLEVFPMGDIDLAELKPARGKDIALMGNLHTTEVMLRGTPALVKQKALEAMRDAGPNGGFILSTGDQCGRDTPEENLFALVETAKQYGVYDKNGHLPAVEEYFK